MPRRPLPWHQASDAVSVRKSEMTDFTPLEAGIITEARAILASAEFDALRRAHRSGQAAEVGIGGRVIVYEPNLPARISGMTLFQEGAFVLGPRAFVSEDETRKTVLHELFRLRSGQAGSGAGRGGVSEQTMDAHAFADRAASALRSG